MSVVPPAINELYDGEASQEQMRVLRFCWIVKFWNRKAHKCHLGKTKGGVDEHLIRCATLQMELIDVTLNESPRFRGLLYSTHMIRERT